MKWWISSLVVLGVMGVARMSQAQANLLVNGDFESPSTNVYYDGFDPSLADDVAGWTLSLGAADGSYVFVSPDAGASTTDVDMGVGPAGGGLQTAVGSRLAVVPASVYQASVTYDNYFAPTGAEYFIDWFDAGGSLLSSSGGPLGDPNGPLGYAPYTQLLSVSGAAPALAATAGVRFEGGNAGYSGLAADNFAFSLVPEPTATALAAIAAAAIAARRRRVR